MGHLSYVLNEHCSRQHNDDHYSAEVILQHTHYFDLGDRITYLTINMKMQNSRKPWCWTNFDKCQNDSGNSIVFPGKV